MAGLALAWLNRHPDVTALIVGPRRPEHFEPMKEALALSLNQEEHQELAMLFARKV